MSASRHKRSESACARAWIRVITHVPMRSWDGLVLAYSVVGSVVGSLAQAGTRARQQRDRPTTTVLASAWPRSGSPAPVGTEVQNAGDVSPALRRQHGGPDGHRLVPAIGE